MQIISSIEGFCKENNISPDDIKTSDDLVKIPLIPDGFFKDYPHGKEFATWLGNIHTGDLPKIEIKQLIPTYDQVIDAFNKAGMLVSYSSGTGGRHTFIPRDQRTFSVSEYAIAKSVVTMIYPFWKYDSSGYLLMPNPKNTNIYAGKVCLVYFDAIQNVNVAIDREITTELIQMMMSGGRGLKSRLIKLFSRRTSRQMIDDIIKWLEYHDKTNEKITFVGAPYILYFVMEKLKAQGRSFDFGERGGVATGGGWKIHENARLSVADFRKEGKITYLPNTIDEVKKSRLLLRPIHIDLIIAFIIVSIVSVAYVVAGRFLLGIQGDGSILLPSDMDLIKTQAVIFTQFAYWLEPLFKISVFFALFGTIYAGFEAATRMLYETSKHIIKRVHKTSYRQFMGYFLVYILATGIPLSILIYNGLSVMLILSITLLFLGVIGVIIYGIGAVYMTQKILPEKYKLGKKGLIVAIFFIILICIPVLSLFL